MLLLFSVTPSVFPQVCEIRAFSLLIDYTPTSLDVQAIRKGQLVNLVNLISWKVCTSNWLVLVLGE